MAKWWYRSPPHRRQMLARDVNYVGIGIARRGSRFTYTAIFTRSRDKTDPLVIIDEATWTSDGSGGTDSDAFSVQAQQFDLHLIFDDGFESGNVSTWTTASPPAVGSTARIPHPEPSTDTAAWVNSF